MLASGLPALCLGLYLYKLRPRRFNGESRKQRGFWGLAAPATSSRTVFLLSRLTRRLVASRSAGHRKRGLLLRPSRREHRGWPRVGRYPRDGATAPLSTALLVSHRRWRLDRSALRGRGPGGVAALWLVAAGRR